MKIKFRGRSGAWLLIILPILLGVLYMHYLSVDKPPQYLTAMVTRADLENAVLSTGTLQAYKQVDVGAQVSGQLKSLKVKLGDKVKKGQWLAEIDPELSRNALRQAKASVDNLLAQKSSAAAQFTQASRAFQRQQQMLIDDATARQDYEAAQANMSVQRANGTSLDSQIRTARIQIETAKANLAFTRIVAPMDGEVIAIVTQEGQTVIAQQQAPVILKLADLDTMTVKAQVSEADVMRVHSEQRAYFTILGEADKRYYGKLREIEPVPQNFLDSQGGMGGGSSKLNTAVFYNALFEVPNPDHRLRVSMTAQVSIVLGTARNALNVVASALGVENKDGSYPVRVLDAEHKVITRQVRVGINNNVRVEVLSGLKDGDRVIISDAVDATDSGSSDGGP